MDTLLPLHRNSGVTDEPNFEVTAERWRHLHIAPRCCNLCAYDTAANLLRQRYKAIVLLLESCRKNNETKPVETTAVLLTNLPKLQCVNFNRCLSIHQSLFCDLWTTPAEDFCTQRRVNRRRVYRCRPCTSFPALLFLFCLRGCKPGVQIPQNVHRHTRVYCVTEFSKKIVILNGFLLTLYDGDTTVENKHYRSNTYVFQHLRMTKLLQNVPKQETLI